MRATIIVAWHISYSIDVILRTKLELFVNVLCWVARQFGEPILKSPVSYFSKVQTVAIIASRNERHFAPLNMSGGSLDYNSVILCHHHFKELSNTEAVAEEMKGNRANSI